MYSFFKPIPDCEVFYSIDLKHQKDLCGDHLRETPFKPVIETIKANMPGNTGESGSPNEPNEPEAETVTTEPEKPIPPNAAAKKRAHRRRKISDTNC